MLRKTQNRQLTWIIKHSQLIFHFFFITTDGMKNQFDVLFIRCVDHFLKCNFDHYQLCLFISALPLSIALRAKERQKRTQIKFPFCIVQSSHTLIENAQHTLRYWSTQMVFLCSIWENKRHKVKTREVIESEREIGRGRKRENSIAVIKQDR